MCPIYFSRLHSIKHGFCTISNLSILFILSTALLPNLLTQQEMMIEQLRIIFKTLQGMKATDEAEIGLDRNLLPLKDAGSLQSLEEQLQSSPDLQKQLVCWRIIYSDHISSNCQIYHNALSYLITLITVPVSVLNHFSGKKRKY